MMDIFTIGTATRDVFLRVPLLATDKDQKKIVIENAQCFALGAKLEVARPVLAVGGGASNAAVTFARQQLKTGIVAHLGHDMIAENILKTILSEKINPFFSKSVRSGTAYSTILLNKNGERTVLVYRGASEELQKNNIPPISKLQARWTYCVPGAISFRVIENTIQQLVKKKIMIAMNPSYDYCMMGITRMKKIMSMCKVVLLNKEEASLLLNDQSSAHVLVHKLQSFTKGGIALITDGPRGAWVSDGIHVYHSGIFKEKQLVDRTGAGDAFGSGFVAGLMQKNDIVYALRLASANATSVVERIGAQEGILTPQQFKNTRWRSLEIQKQSL